MAPEFYKLLSSPELKNTPLGRSLELQNQILGEVSAGLGGKAFGATGRRGNAGALPPDMVSAIGENLNSQMAASGTLGSPAGAIRAAMKFSGASEGIRQQRIASAQSALGQIGGASIMPSASEFLQVGANKAAQAANLEMQAGQQIYGAHQAHKNQLWEGVGMLGGMAAAPFTGGASMGLMGGLGGLFGGGGQADPHNIGGARYFGPMSDAQYGGGRSPFGMGSYDMLWGTPNYLTGTGYGGF